MDSEKQEKKDLECHQDVLIMMAPSLTPSETPQPDKNSLESSQVNTIDKLVEEGSPSKKARRSKNERRKIGVNPAPVAEVEIKQFQLEASAASTPQQ